MGISTAIMGKGSAGKTFVAVNLATTLGSMGERTLVVGCDQKRDTVRALSREPRPSLLENLEMVSFAYDELSWEGVITRVNEYVDVVELGASPILTGHYGAVLDEAFHAFEEMDVWKRYDHLIFDVTDERFDGAYLPLLRKVDRAIAVTTEDPGSFWVINRLIRAVLIGGYEFGMKVKLTGVINNRSTNSHVFDKFVEQCRLFPLMTIPEQEELASLRPFSRTLAGMEPLPESLKEVFNHFLMLADMVRGEPISVYPLNPLDDEAIWALSPPVSLPK